MVPKLPYLVLRYHFRLPNLVANDSLGWKMRQLHMLRIANTFRAIELGLTKPIVIADAYATTVGREMQAAERDAQVQLAGQAVSDQMKASLVNQAKMAAARAADPVAMSMRGTVLLKKKVALGLSAEKCDQWLKKDPRARMTPDQMSSIHLNFPDLLQNSAVNLVCVARTLIHEASHKFCDTRDFAYADAPEYRQLTLAQSSWNADSFAYTAISLYKNALFTTHLSMQQPPAGVDMNS